MLDKISIPSELCGVHLTTMNQIEEFFYMLELLGTVIAIMIAFSTCRLMFKSFDNLVTFIGCITFLFFTLINDNEFDIFTKVVILVMQLVYTLSNANELAKD